MVLGYRVRLLVYDLRNFTKDTGSQRRLDSTIDERYIGPPYLTAEQSEIVKSAIVDVPLDPNAYPALREYMTAGGEDSNSSDKDDERNIGNLGSEKSFESVLGILLNRFLDKRRASGDARPCGPHHLAPLYAALFGIRMDELQEDSFVRRVRRDKLGTKS